MRILFFSLIILVAVCTSVTAHAESVICGPDAMRPGVKLRVRNEGGAHERPLVDADARLVGLEAGASGQFNILSECGIKRARVYVKDGSKGKEPTLVGIRAFNDQAPFLAIIPVEMALTWTTEEYRKRSPAAVLFTREFIDYVVCVDDQKGNSSVTNYRVNYIAPVDAKGVKIKSSAHGVLKIDEEELDQTECPFKE